MDAVWVALIVAVLGPVLLSYLNSRQQAKKEARDYARQDAVAEQAREAARLLLVSNERAARTAKTTNEQAAQTAQVTNDKLDVIHTLVNSTLTETMEAQLEATEAQLGMMRQLLAGDTEPPPPELVSAVEEKIARMRAALTDRLEQTKVAEAQIAKLGRS